MTATDSHHARIVSDPLSLLPLALIITMLGVAVLLAQVAPARMTSGVYQVIVGQGATQFTLATESLTCSRSGADVTCTAPVAGQQLAVYVKYHDPGSPIKGSSCAARHGDRPVYCTSGIEDYGHASNSVRISDQLGVTEPELTRLRDAVPWWRNGSTVLNAALALLCVLTATGGVLAYLLSGRTRPRTVTWRFPLAVGTGVLGLMLLAASGLVIAPSESIDHVWLTLLLPPTVIPSALLAVWQWRIGRAGAHGRGRRWAQAIGAAIATALYTAAALAVFLVHSGFFD